MKYDTYIVYIRRKEQLELISAKNQLRQTDMSKMENFLIKLQTQARALLL